MSFAPLKLTLDAVLTELGCFERKVQASVSFSNSVAAGKAGATAAERRTPTSWGG